MGGNPEPGHRPAAPRHALNPHTAAPPLSSDSKSPLTSETTARRRSDSAEAKLLRTATCRRLPAGQGGPFHRPLKAGLGPG